MRSTALLAIVLGDDPVGCVDSATAELGVLEPAGGCCGRARRESVREMNPSSRRSRSLASPRRDTAPARCAASMTTGVKYARPRT